MSLNRDTAKAFVFLIIMVVHCLFLKFSIYKYCFYHCSLLLGFLLNNDDILIIYVNKVKLLENIF